MSEVVMDLQNEELWGELTAQLEGYVKVRTNRGFVKVPLRAPYQEELADEAEKMERPEPPTQTITLKSKNKKGEDTTTEVVNERDPGYRKALEEYGMRQTFLLLDMSLVDQPAGKTFEDRVKAYKKLSAPALGSLIAGIQALMMNELTADMMSDQLDAEEAAEVAGE